jgi:hypothetical protein
MWLEGTFRIDGVRGDVAVNVGRGIRLGVSAVGSRESICNNRFSESRR